MINLELLEPSVLADIREAGGYSDLSEAGQREFDALLGISSVPELLDKYLSWHGIVNYTEQILGALEAICAADLNNPAHLCQKLVAYNWDAEEASYLKEFGGDLEHAAAQDGEPHIFCVLARLHLANN